MIGITFEGGGTRGSYQVGAYLALLDCHIKPKGVCGTSIGSFNAAMIAAKDEKKLLKFWQNIDVAKMLDLDKFKDFRIRRIPQAISGIIDIVKNKGIDTSGMKREVNKVLNVKKLYKSKIEYGLCTVKLNSFKPLYLYKKDIPKSKIVDYIIASCYLPLFKMEKIIDDSYYLDGGFYDNSPVSMLIKKGYDKIYCIGVKGIGRHRKRPKGVNIIDIIPSRPLGGVLSLSSERLNNNIKIGYFDTLKVIKKLDGKKFCFKKLPFWYYDLLVRKVDERLLNRSRKFWKTNDNKKIILKSLEFIMREEKMSYFEIYHPYKLAKLIRKSYNKKYFIYKFINELKLF